MPCIIIGNFYVACGGAAPRPPRRESERGIRARSPRAPRAPSLLFSFLPSSPPPPRSLSRIRGRIRGSVFALRRSALRIASASLAETRQLVVSPLIVFINRARVRTRRAQQARSIETSTSRVLPIRLMPRCPVASSILIAALTSFDGKVKGLGAQLSPKFYDGYARLAPLDVERRRKRIQKFRCKPRDSPPAAGKPLIIPFRRNFCPGKLLSTG